MIGAGGMARAMAWDLRHVEPFHNVVVLDHDPEALEGLANFVGRDGVQTVCGDAGNGELLKELMTDASAAIGAASYRYHYHAAAEAVQSGAHWVDLGGNPTVVKQQFSLHDKAVAARVGVIPDAGLAPGLINIIGGALASRLDTIDELHFRVGGLPQFPKPPLFYGLVFSPEGLANEYHEPAWVIEDGNVKEVESLTGWERVYFGSPLGTLEAFHTSGGASTMVETFTGKVTALDYKTLRYPGHLRKIKLLGDLGFWKDDPISPSPVSGGGIKGGGEVFETTPRAVLGEMLKRLGWVTEDLVALVAWGIGRKAGRKHRVDIKMADYYDPTTKLTSMARTTGFPAVILARMLAEGELTERGVLRQEVSVPPERMFEELAKRGVKIEVKESQF